MFVFTLKQVENPSNPFTKYILKVLRECELDTVLQPQLLNLFIIIKPERQKQYFSTEYVI